MRYLLVVVIVIAAFIIGSHGHEEPKATGVLVSRVIDGDTFVTTEGERIRLAGINAPERGEAGSAEATAALGEFIAGRLLTLEQTSTDKYGRTVACVYRGSRSVDNYMKKYAEAWKGVRCN